MITVFPRVTQIVVKLSCIGQPTTHTRRSNPQNTPALSSPKNPLAGHHLVFAADTTAILLEQVPPTPLHPAHGFELLMLLSHVRMFAAVVHGTVHDRLPRIWDQNEPCYMTCHNDTHTHTCQHATTAAAAITGYSRHVGIGSLHDSTVIVDSSLGHQHADMIWVGNQRIDIDRVGSLRASL